MVGRFTADSVPVRGADGAARADVVIEGLEQAGPSFTGHVFLDAPDASADTPRTAEHGYAGSFSVFGQGSAMAARGPERPEGGGAAAPITKEVIATEALAAAAARGAEAVSVTIVAETRGEEPLPPLRPSRVSVVVR